LMDSDSYGAAVNRCNTLLGVLGKQMMGGGATVRDHYFEVAYYYVVSFTRAALKETDPMKRENYLTRTAKFLHTLMSNHPTLGGDESKERFENFLKTPDGMELQKYLDKLK
jgi:hypothetical protein